MIHGAIWPLRGRTMDDMYGCKVVVYRNTTPLKNRARQRDYIWAVENEDDGKIMAIATEVPLVGTPLVWLRGNGPVVVGTIPPGPMIIHDAERMGRNDFERRRLRACVLTSDGEIWGAR